MIPEHYRLIENILNKIQYESVLDIGCRESMIKSLLKPKKYIGVDLENANVNLDLNKINKLPIKDNSFDLVIASQILEHLFNPLLIISEIKRISKKYILIGLPNEYPYDNRIRFLLRKDMDFKKGYQQYSHHYLFDPETIEKFISENFKGYKLLVREYLFGSKGGRFLPKFFRQWLANYSPNLFSKEVYYLLEKS